MKLGKKVKSLLLCGVLAIGLFAVGCETEANKVSYNVSQEAENFNVIRRLTVINARSDKPTFELIGQFSIEVDSDDNQLEVICETGKGEYKKHFIGLSDNVTYVIEDITGADVDKYHYTLTYNPNMWTSYRVESID